MTGIEWSALTWEAFATLFTGVLAISGAVWVGLRQAVISERQVRLLERQVHLEALSLRIELFDRRYAVYQSVREYLGTIANRASQLGGPPPSQEQWNRMLSAIQESRFLFNENVQNGLNELRDKALTYQLDRADYARTQEQFSGKHPEIVQKAAGRLIDQEQALAAELDKMPQLFGEHIRLFQPTAD